ncbi:histone-lysine N-methyltransferase, H3 lysine-79 specific-like [Stegodyphus dumicola]|uniref:histone-lysine N-methyltransferase, H3 lysine-79 specific-like n=1 Tax=Stegodyphus dumicola TaxID=202533 RepID=UPI0015B19DB4|nr:histone-lysine N-methyltransferase, H3 lysine-79 specific-like [Stegodyphus dumicola]
MGIDYIKNFTYTVTETDILEFMSSFSAEDWNSTPRCFSEGDNEVEIIRELKTDLNKHRCYLCCQGDFLVNKMLHFSGILNNDYKFACETCDKSFKCKSALTKHKYQHVGTNFERNQNKQNKRVQVRENNQNKRVRVRKNNRNKRAHVRENNPNKRVHVKETNQNKRVHVKENNQNIRVHVKENNQNIRVHVKENNQNKRVHVKKNNQNIRVHVKENNQNIRVDMDPKQVNPYTFCFQNSYWYTIGPSIVK